MKMISLNFVILISKWIKQMFWTYFIFVLSHNSTAESNHGLSLIYG